jgi:hypothetical protein
MSSVALAQHEHHAGVDTRGQQAMGFDLSKTKHHFKTTKSGGVIEVTATDAKDGENIAKIHSHLKEIAASFAKGDFTTPAFIHAQNPPGTDVLRRLGNKVSYTYKQLSNGAQVVIATRDKEGIDAVHKFFAMQIKDHRTGDRMQH